MSHHGSHSHNNNNNTNNADEVKILEEQETIYTHINDNLSDDSKSQTNMFFDFIKQLRPSMDLYRIAVPPVTLEPRSMLERLSLYSTFHTTVLNVGEMKNPEQRFLTILRWFIATLRTTPKKSIMLAKPYNPILGEEFHCFWQHKDSYTTFIAEQVSHHPPVSSFYCENRKKNIIFEGSIMPKSKFHGNSISSIMDGKLNFHVLSFGETYEILFPHVVARGILFGSQYLEVNNKLQITCAKTGYTALLDYKSKKDNIFDGQIKKGDEVIYTIAGQVDGRTTITDVKKKRDIVFLDVSDIPQLDPIVTPVSQQLPNESRRVWHKLTYGLVNKNYDIATKAKVSVEEAQRVITKDRHDKGIKWQTKYFLPKGDTWAYKHFNDKPYSPEEEFFAPPINPIHKHLAQKQLENQSSSSSPTNNNNNTDTTTNQQ